MIECSNFYSKLEKQFLRCSFKTKAIPENIHKKTFYTNDVIRGIKRKYILKIF